MCSEEGHIEICWGEGRKVELHKWEHMIEQVCKMQQLNKMVVVADEML
jgi:hypothetical protein